MFFKTLWQIAKTHFVVALMVGLVVGTLIGLCESLYALISLELVGRYNELVAWAIVIDASALIAAEFGFALLSGLIFLFRRRVPLPRQLVSLQLGETVFALVFAQSLWSQGFADASVFTRNLPGVILPPAALGLVLGECILAASMWITDHAPFTRRLRARYWLLLEAATIVVAIIVGYRP